MKLNLEQEKELMLAYQKAKEKNALVKTSKADIQQRARLKRAAHIM